MLDQVSATLQDLYRPCECVAQREVLVFQASCILDGSGHQWPLRAGDHVRQERPSGAGAAEGKHTQPRRPQGQHPLARYAPSLPCTSTIEAVSDLLMHGVGVDR